MIKNTTLLLCLLALSVAIAWPGIASAEENPLPFHMPVPDGWRTESLTMPLEFAPSLPYHGLEEVRFAPGMFVKDSAEFWTYTFVWWVGADSENAPEALAKHLETYFRGLATAVASSREVSVDQATFSAELKPMAKGVFSGKVETFDPFVTLGQVHLNAQVKILACSEQGQQAIIFGFSPQDADHKIWADLGAIQEGFRCTPQDNPES